MPHSTRPHHAELKGKAVTTRQWKAARQSLWHENDELVKKGAKSTTAGAAPGDEAGVAKWARGLTSGGPDTRTVRCFIDMVKAGS